MFVIATAIIDASSLYLSSFNSTLSLAGGAPSSPAAVLGIATYGNRIDISLSVMFSIQIVSSQLNCTRGVSCTSLGGVAVQATRSNSSFSDFHIDASQRSNFSCDTTLATALALLGVAVQVTLDSSSQMTNVTMSVMDSFVVGRGNIAVAVAGVSWYCHAGSMVFDVLNARFFSSGSSLRGTSEVASVGLMGATIVVAHGSNLSFSDVRSFSNQSNLTAIGNKYASTAMGVASHSDYTTTCLTVVNWTSVAIRSSIQVACSGAASGLGLSVYAGTSNINCTDAMFVAVQSWVDTNAPSQGAPAAGIGIASSSNDYATYATTMIRGTFFAAVNGSVIQTTNSFVAGAAVGVSLLSTGAGAFFNATDVVFFASTASVVEAKGVRSGFSAMGITVHCDHTFDIRLHRVAMVADAAMITASSPSGWTSAALGMAFYSSYDHRLEVNDVVLYSRASTVVSQTNDASAALAVSSCGTRMAEVIVRNVVIVATQSILSASSGSSSAAAGIAASAQSVDRFDVANVTVLLVDSRSTAMADRVPNAACAAVVCHSSLPSPNASIQMTALVLAAYNSATTVSCQSTCAVLGVGFVGGAGPPPLNSSHQQITSVTIAAVNSTVLMDAGCQGNCGIASPFSTPVAWTRWSRFVNSSVTLCDCNVTSLASGNSAIGPPRYPEQVGGDSSLDYQLTLVGCNVSLMEVVGSCFGAQPNGSSLLQLVRRPDELLSFPVVVVSSDFVCPVIGWSTDLRSENGSLGQATDVRVAGNVTPTTSENFPFRNLEPLLATTDTASIGTPIGIISVYATTTRPGLVPYPWLQQHQCPTVSNAFHANVLLSEIDRLPRKLMERCLLAFQAVDDPTRREAHRVRSVTATIANSRRSRSISLSTSRPVMFTNPGMSSAAPPMTTLETATTSPPAMTSSSHTSTASSSEMGSIYNTSVVMGWTTDGGERPVGNATNDIASNRPNVNDIATTASSTGRGQIDRSQLDTVTGTVAMVAASSGAGNALAAAAGNPLAASAATKATQLGRTLMLAACSAADGSSGAVVMDDVSYVWTRGHRWEPSPSIALWTTTAALILAFAVAAAVGHRLATGLFTAAVSYYGPNGVNLAFQVFFASPSSAPPEGALAPAVVAMVFILLIIGACARAVQLKRCGSRRASHARGVDDPTSKAMEPRWTVVAEQLLTDIREPAGSVLRRLQGVIDLAVGVIAAAGAGMKQGSVATCGSVALLVAAVYAAQIAYLIYIQPLASRRSLGLSCVNAAGMALVSLIAAATIFSTPAVSVAVGVTTDRRELLMSLTRYLVMALSALFYGELVLEVGLSMRRKCCRSPSVLPSNTADETALLTVIPDAGDVPAAGSEAPVFNPLLLGDEHHASP